MEALCARTHFLRVFRARNEPAKPSKLWPLHRDDFNRSCILLLRLWPKSSVKTVACPRACVLIAKFVHCVQTLESRLGKAEIAANFGQRGVPGLSLFWSAFWSLSLSIGARKSSQFLSQFEAPIQRETVGPALRGMGEGGKGECPTPFPLWRKATSSFFKKRIVWALERVHLGTISFSGTIRTPAGH